MPSRITDGAVGTRFELPALDFDFGSITDGTDIPPPELSPQRSPQRSPDLKLPTPPETPSSRNDDAESKTAIDLKKPSTPLNGNLLGPERPAEIPPLSPAESVRPGSLRRLFSRTMMNNSYADGQLPVSGSVASMSNTSRPQSQGGISASASANASASASVADERKSKRASGWFRRLRSADSQAKRRSGMFGHEEFPAASAAPPASTAPTAPTASAAPKKPAGPPAPKIPELLDFDKDKGGLGNDLFNHIK